MNFHFCCYFSFQAVFTEALPSKWSYSVTHFRFQIRALFHRIVYFFELYFLAETSTRLKAIAKDVRSEVLGSNAVWFSEGPPMLAAWIFLVSPLAYSFTIKMEAKRLCTYTDLNDVTTQKFVTCITKSFISASPHQISLRCSNQRG